MSVAILRSIGFSTDSRAVRFKKLIEQEELRVSIFDWGSDTESVEETCMFERRRGSKLRNILLTPLFMLWLFAVLVRKRKKIDVVFAIDLDTAIPGFFAAKLMDVPFVYDIADPFSLGRLGHSVWIIDSLEGWIASKANISIIPDRCRAVFYKSDINWLVIENVPDFKLMEASVLSEKLDREELIVGYFGTLETKHRGLEDLVSCVQENEHYRLLIGGSGELEGRLRSESEKSSRIEFIGRFDQKELLKLMHQVDVLYAPYYITKEHHKYVAANKTYEHLLAGKPIITSSGSNFSKIIDAWGTGYCFNAGQCGLGSVLEVVRLDSEGRLDKSKTATDIWKSQYSDYWANSVEVHRFSETFRRLHEPS